MSSLLSLDFASPAAVLEWVAAMVEPVDRVGVAVDKDGIRAVFAANGWPVGVNCGEDFDGTDPRNYAGWLVGQWLEQFDGRLASTFVAKWRHAFARVPA